MENKTHYRRQHFSSSLCFLSYRVPWMGQANQIHPPYFIFLRIYVLFQRKAVGSTKQTGTRGNTFSHHGHSSLTPRCFPQSLCSRSHCHPPSPSLFSSAIGHGNAAEERARHSSANVWDTDLVNHPLERVRSWHKLAKTPYSTLKYPIALAYRESRCQTRQMPPFPSRQIHPVTTPQH